MNGSAVAGKDPLIHKLRLMEAHDTEAFIEELSRIEKPAIVGFLNQHGYNLAQHQSRVFNSFMRMDYLLRDGIGIKLACRVNGLPPRANLNGSDFIPRLLAHFSQGDSEYFQFFAMGTQEPWLSRGARQLFAGHAVHTIDGFRAAEEYVDFVRAQHKPGRLAVVLLAMGMPKQEEVALQLQQRLEAPALMICGGAILDFAAQRFPRAPKAFRRLGLEWLFRLMMEPRRLFHRYVVGIPLFFAHVWRNGRGTGPQAGQGPNNTPLNGSDGPRHPREQDDKSLETPLAP